MGGAKRAAKHLKHGCIGFCLGYPAISLSIPSLIPIKETLPYIGYNTPIRTIHSLYTANTHVMGHTFIIHLVMVYTPISWGVVGCCEVLWRTYHGVMCCDVL